MSTPVEVNTSSDHATQKPRTGTGVQDRSEVERMIQRYLELAASALKEDAPENKDGNAA